MKKLLTLVAILAVAGSAFALEPGGIAGVVVDQLTGNPIEGAMVIARGEAGQMGRARTNARGAYLIDELREGRYRVSASARGYESAVHPGAVGVRAGEITRGVNFRLRPKQQPEPGVITGQVVDQRTGEPIRGAAVVAVSRGCRRRARTDDHGRYALRGLKPGVYRVKAKARHYFKEAFPRGVPVRAGQTVSDINFALKPKPHKGIICGRVVDVNTHRPIAGAAVIAHGQHGHGRALTDRHGYYRITRLNPGEYRVSAAKRGYHPKTFPRPVPVRPGKVTRNIDFFLHAIRTDAE